MRLRRVPIVQPGLECVAVEGVGAVCFRDGLSADLPEQDARMCIRGGVAVPEAPSQIIQPEPELKLDE